MPEGDWSLTLTLTLSLTLSLTLTLTLTLTRTRTLTRYASHCICSWSLYEVATARAEAARGSWLSRARNLVGA